MAVSIISRTAWGAKPWDNNPNSSGPATVALSARTEFFVHYDGGTPITRTGYAIPRAIEAEHLANGWAGIGYNFVVSQAGEIFEGRGWDRQGAHCPEHNISGFGVQIAVGGDQEPTPAALAACRALYEEACERTGRTLAKKGHKDGYATLCPGTRLYAWVQAGMPAQGYKPAPNPGGSLPGGAEVARYQVTIGGLVYGYGAVGDHVTRVGQELVARGFGRHYTSGPGPVWTDADTLCYSDFQRSLGYSGADADGVPGETSLKKLLGALPTAAAKATVAPPAFPGRRHFRPGQSNAYVTQLGKQLVAKGYGRHYTQGPGPTWTENDRKNTEAFQLAQGWTGADADGYPGPETWRRLFS
ncbi:peptidoglycan-binding protein [Streptomyces sp. NPDC087317]|uniref:peptidoglycan-binding protein n=1 Tax=Streptomyces sp. NPDC087317 TaxID=3365784 RepID=UPI0038236940